MSVLFDPADDLVIVEVNVFGPHQSTVLRLAVDTGAVVTLLTHDALDLLGYGARDGYARTTITTTAGKEPGYLLRVRRLIVFEQEFADVPIHAHDLVDTQGLHGLLGLDVLRRFHVEFRFDEGVLRAEPAGPA